MRIFLGAETSSQIFSQLESSLRKSKKYFSIEQWSKDLGFKSPRGLSMVLKGKRLPSDLMLEKISQNLKLKIHEEKLVKLLVKKDRLKQLGKLSLHELSKIEDELSQLKSFRYFKEKIFSLKEEEGGFSLSCYTFAIRQYLKDRSESIEPKEIALKFKNKLSEREILAEIKQLLKFKLLSLDEKRYSIDPNEAVEIREQIPSEGLKKYHTQCLQRALESLYEDSVGSREHLSLTLRFRRERFSEAQKFVQDFSDQFRSRFVVEESEDIAQLNIQLFLLTQ